MSRSAWGRLDNASNIFLAARSVRDPKVFRISAEVDHEVDPVLLQEALDATYQRYPLYRAVLRRGVFWYYLQDSDLHPTVTADEQSTCAPIYQADRKNLLFRVIHHRRRINLEVFHALSDGTGALWFLTDLVTAYLRRHKAQDDTEATADEKVVASIEPPHEDVAEPVHELSLDAFAHYFHRRRRRRAARRAEPAASAKFIESGTADASEFSRAAEPAPLTVAARAVDGAGDDAEDDLRTHFPPTSGRKVYAVRGTRTPDNRPRLVELSMPATEVLALARAEGVALTMYLTAVFFESVRRASGGLGSTPTLSASVPVNLRQFFPSTSARNFFATIRVEHTYGKRADTPGAVARRLEREFRAKATPEELERKLRTFIRFEKSPLLRVVPRPLKDVLLGAVNRVSNRALTVAVSNLGRVSLPEAVDARVGRMLFHVSAVRPQFCVMSHAGVLTISFTSPYVETDHVREFARVLTDAGIDVTVAAARATEQELEEAAA